MGVAHRECFYDLLLGLVGPAKLANPEGITARISSFLTKHHNGYPGETAELARVHVRSSLVVNLGH
jgi:hypothetical protein